MGNEWEREMGVRVFKGVEEEKEKKWEMGIRVMKGVEEEF